MARPLKRRLDHRGARLPAGVYPLREGGARARGYRVRWREQGAAGASRQASRAFTAAQHGSLDRALDEALLYREAALRSARIEGSILRGDPAAGMTLEALFEEWCRRRGTQVSERYAEKVARCWARQIGPRIGAVRLARLSQDPAILTRFQDELIAARIAPGSRVEILKTLRSVLRWGRRRHPGALTVEFSGLFEMPRARRRRLAFATDAYGLERLIEAVAARGAHDDLRVLRDVAFVAAMGFTIAARPSEWLYSATWGDLHRSSVELQRPLGDGDDLGIGLKTGARAALLLGGASLRLSRYRAALEERHGAQPDEALVFQALGPEGPLWARQGGERVPLAWDRSDYLNWTARVWRPARELAASLDDVPNELARMRFYDCRHTAISMALHSTLVSGPHGMNLHNLAGWAGHDVQTLQRHYSHIIARYHGAEAIDLGADWLVARARVAAAPNRRLGEARASAPRG